MNNTKITLDEIKVMLRETGVKVKPNYDYGHSIVVSAALKQTQKDYLKRLSKNWGTSQTFVLNRLIQTFKPIEKNIKFFLTQTEAKSTAGFINKKVMKVFGSRKNIKFQGFSLDKTQVQKLNELSSYYGISRSAMIRFIIDYNINA